MRLDSLKVKNFRTVNDLDITFPTYYTAICGKNDSGKTNIIRCIQAVFEIDYSPFATEDSLSLKRDFPRWKKGGDKHEEVMIEATCTISKEGDAGLYLFLKEYLKLDTTSDITLRLRNTCNQAEPLGDLIVYVNDSPLSEIQSQEVINKLQSIRVFFFHNSTERLPSPFRSSQMDLPTASFDSSETEAFQAAKRRLNNAIAKSVKQQQKDLSGLLGRLRDKYKVGIRASEFNPLRAPLSITLGEEEVDLEHWGSGTQNRTRILLKLFEARRLSQSGTSASKITPVVIIEEPESFLHPSAQAEFGRMLQELSNEFKIQILVSTHSPYMLSCQRPESNVLVERKLAKGVLRESEVVDTRSDRWMEPFALALGISNSEFEPWRKAVFKSGDSILLVEGQGDFEYLSLCQKEEMGSNRLNPSIEIVPYGGKDRVKSAFFLRFIRERHQRCVITFDLDVEDEVLPVLTAAGFTKGSSCFCVGTQSVKSIEGLLPESVAKQVQATNPALVNLLVFGDATQKKSAKSSYKKALLDEFKRVAQPTDDYYKGFYPLVKQINRAFR